MPSRKNGNVDLLKLSPNCSKPRTGPINRITPHHMSGNLSIEAILGSQKFTKFDAAAGSSANYVIGSDGRCGCAVYETDRAWTSSSPYNDHRAITFEIANITGDPEWRITDEAINAFVDMSVDICQFYGFKKVNYMPLPTNISKILKKADRAAKTEDWIRNWAKNDEMIISLHNWFTPTTCPGPYFERILPQLIADINRRLSGVSTPKFVGDQTVIIRPVLRQGSSGEFVKELQTKLNLLIMTNDKLIVDGQFGSKTDKMVRDFQSAKGLKIDGAVGPLTWTALDVSIASHNTTPSQAAPSKPEVTFKPYTIRIKVSALNIRKDPSLAAKTVQTLMNDKNVYTIVEETVDSEKHTWGKLKSGLGWICLDYVEKL